MSRKQSLGDDDYTADEGGSDHTIDIPTESEMSENEEEDVKVLSADGKELPNATIVTSGVPTENDKPPNELEEVALVLDPGGQLTLASASVDSNDALTIKILSDQAATSLLGKITPKIAKKSKESPPKSLEDIKNGRFPLNVIAFYEEAKKSKPKKERVKRPADDAPASTLPKKPDVPAKRQKKAQVEASPQLSLTVTGTYDQIIAAAELLKQKPAAKGS